MIKTYTEEEVRAKCLEYFKGDELSATVLMGKYLLKDKSGNFLESCPSDMFERISNEFARIEKNYPDPISKGDIKKAIDDFKYIIPQGSPLYGIGNEHHTSSIANCFLIGSPHDSYSSIIQRDEDLVNVLKRRGGCGLDLSNLRPHGAVVNNAARTSDGVTCYMSRYSNTTKEVAQNGRRGALLISLDCRHPDIERFINCKRDLDKVTGANISVKWTDEFINCVKEDREFILRFPIESSVKDAQIVRTVKARDVWKTFVRANWESAEPGCLFFDRITGQSLSDVYADEGFKTISTNPSLKAETMILTKDGVFPIKTLADNDCEIKVLNINGDWCKAKAFKSGKNKQLVKLTFSNEQHVFCTKEHKWPILNTSNNIINPQTGKVIKKESLDLKRMDKIYFPNFGKDVINVDGFKFSKNDGFVLGWNLGDGWITEHIACNNVRQYGFIFSDEDIGFGIGDRVLDYTNKLAKVASTLRQDHDSKCMSYSTTDKNVRDKMFELGADYKENGIPKTIWISNFEFISGFIDGLFSSDGYVGVTEKLSTSRIVLVSAYKNLAHDVQKLLSFYGIKSNVKYSNKNGYHRYDVYIGGIFVKKFANLFSLSNKNKQAKLNEINDMTLIGVNKKSYKNNRDYLVVKNVELTDVYEDVYDITVFDDTHTFLMETGITGNCGELPLSEYSACLLMALNLTSFVKNPYEDNAKFDKECFDKYVRMAIRLMDDMVDLEIEKVKHIIEKIKNDKEPIEVKQRELDLWKKILNNYHKGRRVGLGATGLADMIAMLNLKYDGDNALIMVESIFKQFHEVVMDEDAEMSKSRGKFPIWDWEKEKNCHYIKILSRDTQDKIKKYGRRNISLTTVAPAGSISIIAQTSSGVEPVFNLSYTRKRKMTTEEVAKGLKHDSVDNDGVKWVSYEINHHGFEKWKKIHPHKKFENSPYYGCEANQIDWKYRVKLQGIIQKYITHSISSTLNLKKDITEQEISDIYLASYDAGCKGVTIYRDGSRKGVLTSKDDKKLDMIVDAVEPERGEILECDVHYSAIEENQWILLVGLKYGRPYEIFGGKRDKIEIPHKYKKGWIRKNGVIDGRRTYDLILGSLEGDEKMVIKDIADVFSAKMGSYTRMISFLLRIGAPMKTLCEQLYKDNAVSMFTFERGVARVLKKYIKDGEKASGRCENCKSENMQYRDGCAYCVDCGFSKCN